MINWPEMFRYAEDWRAGFFTGVAAASLIVIVAIAMVLLGHAV